MSKINMPFLKDFNKGLEKEMGIGDSSEPPRYWYTSGNYVLNRIMSGSFYKAIPQGRITALVGPSMTGKSLLAGCLLKEAQKAGAFAVAIDSENAWDDTFMTNLGVNVEENYMYKSVTTISNTIKVVSSFLKGYRAEYAEDLVNAPQVIIGIDSMDMLSTDQELEHFEKGDNSSDQGLRAKQLKQMLRQFVQAIKDLNVAMVVTGQVYRAKQDQILQGEGVWIVNEAIRYALSQITLLKKLKLKDKDKEILGFRMIAEGFKTRFTKPFQTVEIEVPYDTGIDPYSGLKECLIGLGVIEQPPGSYLVISDTKEKFRASEIGRFAENLLVKAEAMSNEFVKADVTEAEVDTDVDTAAESKAKRKKAAKGE